jgi:alanyl aminopeptidase
MMTHHFRRSFANLPALFFAFLLIASAAAPTAFAAPTPPLMQLDETVKPLAYDAELTLLPERDKFDGRILIDIDITKAQDFFWINAYRIDIKRATLTIGNQLLVASAVAGNDQFIGLQFDSVLPTGKGRLAIDYSGQVSATETRGLFRQKEGGDWYLFSQFEPMSARRAFPSFDQPNWKTPWTLALTVRREHVAVSNSPVLGEENVGADMKRIRFAPTPPLPTYLVALGVGPFDVVDGGTAGMNRIPLRYITPRGHGSEVAYAAKVTPQLLSLLEEYFGRPYPYAKLDSMVIPVTVAFGAMENAGLITYRSGLLLSAPEKENDRFRQRYASVGAHEIAHQWFGDLVTMHWWTDIWLNESFATWMARKTVAKFSPQWDVKSRREYERQHAMHVDRLSSTRQVRQAVNKPDDLANAFDGITYDKGGAVLTMFESLLGEAAFRDGVRRYLNRHAFGNASAEDFFAALSESDPALAKGFSSFVEQPGVPQVSVAMSCKGKPTLNLEQRRFMPIGASEASKAQRWIIPVCVRYAGQKSDQPFCTILREAKASVALPEAKRCPAWLLPNPAGVGYFLPVLESGLLARLRKAPLKSDEVVSLLSDLSMLASSAEFSQAQALDLAAKYANDPRPEVASAAVALAARVQEQSFDAVGLSQRQQWVRRHFSGRAKVLGWIPRENESDMTAKLRIALLPLAANLGADPELRAQARELALKWLGGKDAPKIGAMLAPLLNAAAFSGDQAVFDAMLEAAAASRDNGERQEIFRAFGAFTDPALRNKGFGLVMTDRFDARESVAALDHAAEKPQSASALWQFMPANYAALLARLPEEYASITWKWGAMLCTADDRKTFNDAYQARQVKYPGAARNMAQSLETVDICLLNRSRQEAGLKRFFSSLK